MMELPPFAGEEMNLPHNNPRHDGFVDGERTLAAQVIRILDEGAHNVAITNPREVDAVPREEEMVLGR